MRWLKRFIGASLIVALCTVVAIVLGWHSPTASEETQSAVALVYGFYGLLVAVPLVAIAVGLLESKFRRDERVAEQQRQAAIAAASRESLIQNSGSQHEEK
jgi:hypothetical protein